MVTSAAVVEGRRSVGLWVWYSMAWFAREKERKRIFKHRRLAFKCSLMFELKHVGDN